MFSVVDPLPSAERVVEIGQNPLVVDDERNDAMTHLPSTPIPLIGPAELARRLGVSRDQIYRLTERGELPRPVRVGSLLKWDPRIIEEWITYQCDPAREGARSR